MFEWQGSPVTDNSQGKGAARGKTLKWSANRIKVRKCGVGARPHNGERLLGPGIRVRWVSIAVDGRMDDLHVAIVPPGVGGEVLVPHRNGGRETAQSRDLPRRASQVQDTV